MPASDVTVVSVRRIDWVATGLSAVRAGLVAYRGVREPRLDVVLYPSCAGL
jgi:hypothetical protein